MRILRIWRPTQSVASRRCGLVLAAGLLPWMFLACQRAAAPRNLLLVVVDTLRADHLPIHGYSRDTAPFLSQLAERGLVFERAWAAGGWTKPSVTSILTGLYPVQHGVVHPGSAWDPQLAGLPSWLRSKGFHTIFVNGGNYFLSRRFGFDRGFDAFDGLSPVDAVAVVDRLALRIADRPSEAPFFAYVHFMDTHVPYNTNPFNSLYTSGGGSAELQPGGIETRQIRIDTSRKLLSTEDRQRIRDLYDGQIRWVDQQIERLLSVLEAEGVLGQTLVLITSDHGEEFWEHGGFEHGHSLYPEITHVPMLMVGPGVMPGRSVQPASGVDIAPTLLDAVGISPGEFALDGASLWPIARGERVGPTRGALFASGVLYGPEKYMIVRETTQLIESTADRRGKWKEVGSSTEAGLEFIELSSRDETAAGSARETMERRSELRRRLAAHRSRASAVPPAETEIDEELFRRLEAIGYTRETDSP